jgi:hypothetical protein
LCQKRQFFRRFFGKHILKIITSVPACKQGFGRRNWIYILKPIFSFPDGGNNANSRHTKKSKIEEKKSRGK